MTSEDDYKNEIERLERSNRDLFEFAYLAAHELKEPIRAIDGFLSIFLEKYGPELPDEAIALINEAIAGSGRMTDLISSLLSLACVNSQNIDFEVVDASQVLHEALQDLKSLIDEKEASFKISELPSIYADRTLLSLLFKNLIGNSLKYCGQKPEIVIGASQQPGYWLFTLSDNGIGFDMQYADKIFAPFERLHRKSLYPGAGLGLAFCRRIVDLHGGAIWAESRGVDQGAIFSFKFPSENLA